MLPFIAGAVIGAGVVVAIQKRKAIKENMIEGAKKAQEMAKDVSQTVSKKVDNLTKKDEEPQKENRVEKEVK